MIRDEMGCWLFGFSRTISCCSVENAELWAAHDALDAAWDLGFRHLQLEMDSLTVVRWLGSDLDVRCGCTLLAKVHMLLSRDWRVTVLHVPRSGNLMVDRLATLGDVSMGVYSDYFDVPEGLRDIVEAEARGIG